MIVAEARLTLTHSACYVTCNKKPTSVGFLFLVAPFTFANGAIFDFMQLAQISVSNFVQNNHLINAQKYGIIKGYNANGSAMDGTHPKNN